METVTKSAELKKLGGKIIKSHEDLRWITESNIRIGYCESDLDKRKGGMRMVYAECHKVRPLYQAFIPYDFIIVFYIPSSDSLTNKQREILMYHELLHVGMDESGSLRIIPHDIEDFGVILKEYGMDWNVPEGLIGADMDGT